MAKRVCFVISPIGAKGSDERKLADEFLHFLIEPALSFFDFDIVRADKINQPNSITSDIIKYVQESDLCVADITGANPNVFYELGRRHETGRPFLQLRNSNDSGAMPFDVAGIRTISYDLSSVRAAHESVGVIRSFVEEMERQGFGAASAGHTMASIGEAVTRIERRLMSGATIADTRRTTQSGKEKIEFLLMHPTEAFQRCLEEGDLDGAYTQFQRLKTVASPDEQLAALNILARAGVQPAVDEIIRYIDEYLAGNIQLDFDDLKHAFTSIRIHYSNRGQAAAFRDGYVKIYDQLAKKFDGVERAFFANQVGMLMWTAKDHVTGAKYEKIAVELGPDVVSYWYNRGLSAELTNDTKLIAEVVERIEALNSDDDDHIRFVQRNKSRGR